MASRGIRVGVVGATGALGGEVLAALDQSRLRVSELVPVATQDSLGDEIEFQGRGYPVLAESPSLRGLDLLFLCAPVEPSLEFARQALRAQVPCIDLSGALASSMDVPLRVAAFGEALGEPEPLVATPAGACLAWVLALRPLAEAAGLLRVQGTALESASHGGRQRIASLYTETLALFNQEDLPDSEVFAERLAFDCLPAPDQEEAVVLGLQRLLGSDLVASVTAVQVPVFVGHGAALTVETERALDVKEAQRLLAEAPGVELWDEGPGPSTRAAAGRDVVLVGRVRSDPARQGGLLLWLTADLLRLSASNAVSLATTRLHTH